MDFKNRPAEKIELFLTTSPVEALILAGCYAAYGGKLLTPSRLN